MVRANLVLDISHEQLHLSWSVRLVTLVSVSVDESEVDIESISNDGCSVRKTIVSAHNYDD
jgi:hypothetical protein